jgi:hypothetical protein
MLSVNYAECLKQAHFGECRYAECRYAECLYAECRYAECHGAFDMSFIRLLKWNKSTVACSYKLKY